MMDILRSPYPWEHSPRPRVVVAVLIVIVMTIAGGVLMARLGAADAVEVLAAALVATELVDRLVNWCRAGAAATGVPS